MRWMRFGGAVVGGLALLTGVVAYGAGCGLLPERFAIQGPILHQMTGMGGGKADPETLTGIEAPDGFGVGLFASDLPNVRFLRFTAAGDLVASLPRSGQVVLLRDTDGDGRADDRRTLLEDLDRPHGLDFQDGWLYVGESGGVGRIRFDAQARATEGAYERVVEGLPAGGNHWTRTVGFGPDGWMYVSIGSSCNVCEEQDPRRAAMVRYRPDGSGEEIYATGLRNSVGFDWRPGSGELYATDNGRDLLGDDFPPCELNRIVRGGFYGWPYANGDRVPDPDLGEGHAEEIARSIPPAHGFAAHNAPLGMTFARGEQLPPAYRGAALVALHGSWNRTSLDGYEVVSLHWNGDEIEERPFLGGFLRDGSVRGRPVDVAEGPDGALYVSDDYTGAIYRVAYGETSPASQPSEATASAATAGLALDADPQRGAAVTRGRTLYEAHPCASCHEQDRADPGVVVHPLEGLSARYDRDALAAFLATPTPPMPAFSMSSAERHDLAAFLLQSHP